MLEGLLVLFINFLLIFGKSETLGPAEIKLQNRLNLFCLTNRLIK